MEEAGFRIVQGIHPIVPVLFGHLPNDAKLSQDFANELLKEGIYVIGFYFPVSQKENQGSGYRSALPTAKSRSGSPWINSQKWVRNWEPSIFDITEMIGTDIIEIGRIQSCDGA